MNYLSGAFRYVARGQTESQNNVPRLIDRIKTSALPQDRRDAINRLIEAAKASPQRQVEVGELGLKVLYAVLEQDVEYDETIKAALDLLIIICGRLDPPQITVGASEDPDQYTEALKSGKVFEEATSRAAATNVDVFLGLPNALALLLQLLEKGDFYVKFGTIELLTAMAANSKRTLQMAVLEAAEGVTRICDLLDDKQRHIRSNVVLLLSKLCEESPEICKIIAFGGVLEKLFSLIDAVTPDAHGELGVSEDDIDDEDSLEAAIIVQDVLLVVRNLISGAKTTKTFFRDSGCLQRLVSIIENAVKELGIAQTGDGNIHPEIAVGLAHTIQQQAWKNLNSAMYCVMDLVFDDDEESKSIKNDLVNTSLLTTLMTIASYKGTTASEGHHESNSALTTRVNAFRTISTLIRGHEELRQSFSAGLYQVGSGSEISSMQAVTMNAMLADPSAGVRVAAFTTIRDSFVVDSALNLPSSVLLSALTENGVSERNSSAGITDSATSALLSTRESRAPANPAAIFATRLKEVLVGYPSVSDAAGVFYAARILSWVLREVQGAKDRLLHAKVNGSNLLPQILRLLSRTEREKGAAEVRVSLFVLLCEWLYGSSAAVSAFLSSAMHLPMLVDILKNGGSRGDQGEVHSRGLAAVVLGICLHTTGSSSDARGMEFGMAGAQGSTVVIPRSAVPDVIRNRIGVTAFISCLDELRATKSFSFMELNDSPWNAAEELALTEGRRGFLCAEGSVGHEQWYSRSIVELVNDVYKTVGENVLDLVADANQGSIRSTDDAKKMLTMNGHLEQEDTYGVPRGVIGDSTQDEVITSYKEFIRKQDDSLNEANRQIEELSAALQQAQLEIDNAGNRLGNDLDRSTKTQEEWDDALSQKQALQDLLEEKTADFEALSSAFAALEAEHSALSPDTNSEHSEELAAEIQRLKAQNESLKHSLQTETHKNEELTQRASILDDSVRSKDVELNAVVSERDALKTNAHPEVVEALQWRTRAEVAESKIRSRQELIDSYQNSNAALQDQLREVERTRNDEAASVTALTKRLQSTQAELESLRATRRLELQVSREASAASDASAMKEIAALKEQLEDSRRNLQKEIDARSRGPSSAELGRFDQLQSEYKAVLHAYEKTKTDMADSKQALLQWQKRAETSEATRQRDAAKMNQLVDHARGLEGQLQELKDALISQKETSETSATRASELEQHCKEIDEIRKHTEEELVTLKEQLASRTEQSIRLSTQLYELEEAKETLTEELQTLRAAAPSIPATHAEKVDESHPEHSSSTEHVDPQIEELKGDLSALQKELNSAREALEESKDRESLSSAYARDRDSLVAKIESLEQDLSTSLDEKEKLHDDVNDLKERLLSLDEAEESKRALTMQVVSLQDSLAALERQGTSNTQGGMVDHSDRVKSLEAEMEQFRTRSDEKDMKVQSLESSLKLALEQAETAVREAKDMEKQVSETEAMLSVLQSERDSVMKERDTLQGKIEEISSASEYNSSVIQDLQEELTAAEKMRDAASQELGSLVNACKVAELESKELRDDRIKLQRRLSDTRNQLSEVRNECEEISILRNVSDVVNKIMEDVSLTTQTSVVLKTIGNLQLRGDQATAALEESRTELRQAQSHLEKLPELERERDEAMLRCKDQSNRIDGLTERLVGLQVMASEREKIESSLKLAQASIDDLEKQKSATITALEAAQARIQEVEKADKKDGREMHTLENDTTLKHRVEELEEALRDAAKTVTATNSELIGAQSLLVDLSSDKTAMRAELATSQEQINELVRKVADLSGSKETAPTLSEVSEQDQGSPEDPLVTSSSVVGEESSERSLESLQAEASNLRTALQRSMREADSAADIMGNIEAKLLDIEVTLRESKVAATKSQKSVDLLNAELHRLREVHRMEKETFDKEAVRYNSKIIALQSEIEQAKEAWKETLSMSEESWSAERVKLESELFESRKTLDRFTAEQSALQDKCDRASKEVNIVKESLAAHQKAHLTVSASLKSIEDERLNLIERLEEAKNREESLKDALGRAKSEMQSAKDSFEVDQRRMEEQRCCELKDLEDELDRASNAMESAERAFRDSEMALKENIAQQKTSIQDLERRNQQVLQSLVTTQGNLERVSSEKEQLESSLVSKIRDKESTIADILKEKTELKSSLAVVREERVELRQALRDTENALKQTKWDLKEETEQKAMLESENYDLLSSVESLETSSKRTRSQLSEKTKSLNQAEEKLKDLHSSLAEKVGRVHVMEAEVERKSSEIQMLAESKVKLEKDIVETSDKLKSSEESRNSLAQNNKDLLAWVSDLEKRATELQSAASDFQEVEQNLRDAIESQRYSSEQNSKLVEELRKEKSAVSTAQGRASQLERELGAARSERDSSKRRAQELEARIREIRQSNLVKFSQSEEAIRTKAQQCAELETALASSERKVAELESVSDDLFGATTSLKQLDEEMSTLRGRALTAEETAEGLRKELQDAQREMSEVRDQSSSDALRSLEAEHNELLVYLADLELEVTNLREELGRE